MKRYRSVVWMVVATTWAQVVATPILAQQTNANETPTNQTQARATAILPITSLIPRGLDAPIDPDTYIIGPSDGFILLLGSSSSGEYRFRVLPEGIVILPNVGPMKVSGMTITEFRSALGEALGKFYRKSDVHCYLTLPRSFTVNVLGEVARPGPVEIYAPFRLEGAIAGAGGITELGSLRSIEIRSDSGIAMADQQKFLLVGDETGNPMLHEGQIVYVPVRGPSCAIFGAVWRPHVYEVLPGETIEDIVTLAGGSRPTADLERVVLERIKDGEILEIIEVDRSALASTWLQDRDVVVVPDYPSFVPRARIRIDATSARDGYVLLEEGETIGMLMRRIGRFDPEHDLSSTVIERIGEAGTPEYINIDVQGIIDGDLPDTFELVAGDVISIPRRVDVVFVMGNVVEPRGVPFQRGLPAARYVALAGGPNSDGSPDRLDIFSRDGMMKRSGNRSSVIYRGETIVVNKRKAVIFGKLFFGLTALTSLALSVVAISR